MSYMRPFSNPEGLCIIAPKTNIEIVRGDKPTLFIPTRTFTSLLKKWLDRDPQNEKIVVNSEDGKLSFLELRKVLRNDSDQNDWKWFLCHNSWEVEMWEVTLSCIADRFKGC